MNVIRLGVLCAFWLSTSPALKSFDMLKVAFCTTCSAGYKWMFSISTIYFTHCCSIEIACLSFISNWINVVDDSSDGNLDFYYVNL